MSELHSLPVQTVSPHGCSSFRHRFRVAQTHNQRTRQAEAAKTRGERGGGGGGRGIMSAEERKAYIQLILGCLNDGRDGKV